MTDEKKQFLDDAREKKAIARGARYKKNGSKSKGCSLPSDNFTRKQLLAMNGDISTYDLHTPVSYTDLKKWPEDIQKMYILTLQKEYQANDLMLAEALNCSRSYIVHLRKRLDVGSIQSRKKNETKEWKTFMSKATFSHPFSFESKFLPYIENISVKKDNGKIIVTVVINELAH